MCQVTPPIVESNVGPGFSYQGYLEENGSPVNGTCTFAFRLFDNLTGGNQLGVTQELRGVSVVDGVFAVVLNDSGEFGADAFNGQARWLEITVGCGDGHTTLRRQELLAVPYAQSLRPGAMISGTVSAESGVLNLWSTEIGLNIPYSAGEGMHIDQARGDAIFICSAGVTDGSCTPSANNNGLEIGHAQHNGVQVQMAHNGFDVTEASNAGVYVGEAGHNGLLVNHAVDNGIYVVSAGQYGGRFSGNAAGVYAQADDPVNPDLILGGNGTTGDDGIVSSPLSSSGDIILSSHDTVRVDLNVDGSDEVGSFEVRDNSNSLLFNVDTNGDVGIGTNFPEGKLEITSPNFNDHLVLNRTGAGPMHVTATNPRGLAITDGTPNTFVYVQQATGNVGIGTTNPTTRLAVNGEIRAKEITVETGWSDFVFAEDYELMSLEEIEAYVTEHGHLPDIPSAAEVSGQGVKVGEMESRLLQKIEELTLHLIAMDKHMQELEQENARLSRMLEALDPMPATTKGE